MNDEITDTPLDRHFAALLIRLNGSANPALQRAALTVSARRAEGHTCVPLADLEDAETLEAELRATRVVGAPGEFKPLILDESGRLYLQRYWAYEQQLAAAIRARLSAPPPPRDAALLKRGLDMYFPNCAETDEQRAAAKTALERNFCVITGGPGTGKTRTTVIVLALLHAQFSARGETPRIALAAPTGKAAARMKESISHTLATLPDGETLRTKLPQDATTIHRLLGTIPGSPYFRHDAKQPLAVDAVIVDEASMVDLALMAKLFAAVPAKAPLILLGDRDQLASVEAGHVLGDICDVGDGRSKMGDRGAEHIVALRKNYRFAGDSGIQRLSSLINRGAAEQALELLRGRAGEDVRACALPERHAFSPALRERVLAGYGTYLQATDAREALMAFQRFRILCAVRRGPHGVENLNRLAEQILADAGLIDPAARFYRGQPVIILQNDAQLQIYNGDVALLLPDPAAGGELRATFLDADGTVRRIPPIRLPAHENAYALTVHKSQGSEFGRLLLVLPERDSPVLTRELIYTGLTRAREHVELWFTEPILRAAIERRTTRTSGLRDALRTVKSTRGGAEKNPNFPLPRPAEDFS